MPMFSGYFLDFMVVAIFDGNVTIFTEASQTLVARHTRIDIETRAVRYLIEIAKSGHWHYWLSLDS